MEENKKEFKKLIELVNWKFAKTYASTSPHWYITLRDVDVNKVILKKLYTLTMKLINKYGKLQPFVVLPTNPFKKPKIYYYKVFEFEEFFYWIVEDVINRTYISEEKKIAETKRELRKLGYSEEEIDAIIEEYLRNRRISQDILKNKEKYEEYIVENYMSLDFFTDTKKI